jgi:hypothetical protein
MFRHLYDHHNHLITLMQQLDYKASSVGICHGITLMAVQACATNNINAFNNRLLFIKKHPNLKADIDQLKNKPIKSELTPYEQKLIDVMAFFDGIELNFNPELHPEFFSEPLKYFNSDKISQITASHRLEQKGCLVKSMSWPGIYDTQELNSYFQLLEKIAKNVNQPFSLVFSNSYHSTALYYNPELPGWLNLDSNQLPIRPLNASPATWLKNALFEKNEITIFETSVFLTGNALNAKEIIQFLEDHIAKKRPLDHTTFFAAGKKLKKKRRMVSCKSFILSQ